MDISRIGHILYVKKYEECVAFYESVLELPILIKKEELTCFDLYGTYLMVEKEDRQEYLSIKENHNKVFSCIRINSRNVKSKVAHLKLKNVQVDYQEHPWGIVAKFFDPDGNLLAFKDEESFEKQMEAYISKLK